jgi:pimeloyl-ACP methyl ester carboxylesterase
MPAEAEHRFVRSEDGVHLFARSWGDARQPPLVLIHSWAGAHAAWERQYGGPLARSHRIIAFDLRGCGYSERPAEPSSYLSGATMAADVEAVLASYDVGGAVLVAAPLGGIVLADYLSVHGTRRIAGAALVGSLFAVGPEEAPRLMGPAAPLALDSASIDFAEQYAALKAFVSRSGGEPLSEAEVERQTAISVMTPPHVRGALLRRVADHRKTWSSFDRPLLVIHGEEDRVVRLETARQLAALTPGAALIVMRNAGHIVWRERPEEFDAHLGGWASTVARATAASRATRTEPGS